MEERIILAGFGGQGIMFMGKLICFAQMNKGRQVTYIPSYGAEMRGGTANCNVIVSEDPIASPLVTRGTTVIVMNQPSYDKFKNSVVRGGQLYVNTSLVDVADPPEGGEVIGVPATDLANEMGAVRNANMIMFGVFNYLKNFLELDYLWSQFPDFLGKDKTAKIFGQVRAAILKGEEFARQNYSLRKTPDAQVGKK
jgi:2-oxoglutarate ferredoxin oxidoreductase subunit gamma